MTVSVTVKTRGHPASVTISSKTEGEEGHMILDRDETVNDHSERTFNIEVGETITVNETPEALELTDEAGDDDLPLDPNNVPGRDENDALIQPVGGTITEDKD